MTARYEVTYAERFWANVTKSENGCWIWTGRFTQETGYGVFYRSRQTGPRKQIGAHRLSWELAHGALPPDGLIVCHACDNRACINPAHLFLGTCADNSRDMVVKGRSVRGARARSAVLTDEDVLTMRARLRAGDTNKAIARDFGVSEPHVSGIKHGKFWKHLLSA